MDLVKAGAWLLLSLLLCGATGINAQSLSTTFLTPVTVPLMPGMRTNSSSLDINDPTLAGANATGSMPTQVHLSPAGPGSIFVMWATQNYTVGQGVLTPNNVNSSSSVVMYGTSASSLTMTANGLVEIYNQIYNGSGPATQGPTSENYTSPLLHTVVLANLTPATQYFYKVGDGTNFSATYNFTSLATPGTNYPQRVIVVADIGASHNSTVTRDHAIISATNSSFKAPVLLYGGDFSYADTWFPNGSQSNPVASNTGIKSASYQPVWDMWTRMMEPLLSFIPTITTVGNHEIEQQDDATYSIFQSVQTRWKTPTNLSSSHSYFYYSEEYGPVHQIVLCPYVDYTPGSNQFNWLVQDLLSINRTVTPWVLLLQHNPLITSGGSYKDMAHMLASIESIIYQAGVDVIFYGHVHSYERTYPMYQYMNDPCGISHITVGDGGNTEGLDFLAPNLVDLQFADTNGGCPNVTGTGSNARPGFFFSLNPLYDYFSYYKRVFTFQADGNSTGVGNPPGYCYKSQPAFSAYREPSFGHGTLDVVNATHALWSWNRNQDSVPVKADTTWIVRDTSNCMNKMYPQMRSVTGAQMTAASS